MKIVKKNSFSKRRNQNVRPPVNYNFFSPI